MPKSKIYPTFDAAVADIPNDVTIGFGGFAVVGVPVNLYGALARQGAKGLTCVSNTTRGGATLPEDAPNMEWLIKNDQVKKVVCSFTAPTRASQRLVFTEYYESGRIEAELVPQGTLAERLRAAGAGVPAFYTPAAVGTELAEGRETRVFAGREYLLEEALHALDYAFIRAYQADAFGNLRFRRAQRNFNPLMAMAAKTTIVEVEEDIPARRARSTPTTCISPASSYIAWSRCRRPPKPGGRCVPPMSRPATPSSQKPKPTQRTRRTQRSRKERGMAAEEDIGRAVIGAAIKIHIAVGPGLLESAYEACLIYELEKQRLRVQRQLSVPLRHEEIVVEQGYRLDLLVDGLVVVELKTVPTILPVHRSQLLSYLRLGAFKLKLPNEFSCRANARRDRENGQWAVSLRVLCETFAIFASRCALLNSPAARNGGMR